MRGLLKYIWKKNQNYTEEDSIKIAFREREGVIDYIIDNPKDVDEIRIDPLNVNCICKGIEIYTCVGDEEIKILQFDHNAFVTAQGEYVFVCEDPQIIISKKDYQDSDKIKIKIFSTFIITIFINGTWQILRKEEVFSWQLVP